MQSHNSQKSDYDCNFAPGTILGKINAESCLFQLVLGWKELWLYAQYYGSFFLVIGPIYQ